MTRSQPQEVRARKEAQDAERRKLRMVKLIRMFVSHSNDTHREIDKLQHVIRRLNGLPGTQVVIQPVLWEEHDTPGLGRIQDVVDRNTRMADIDLFVGVCRARIGTPTGRRDTATGREFPGGVAEELATAREMWRNGQLKRVLLYACSDPPPPQTPEERYQATELARWLGELRSGEEGGLIGRYSNPDDFAHKLFFDLLMVVDELQPEPAPTAAASNLVTKLCDRMAQVADFFDFVIEGLRDHPGRPQACILWGEVGQGHDSLVDRLIEIRLKRLASRIWPESEAAVVDHEPVWPEGRDLRELQKRLIRYLLDEFDDLYMGTERSARALTGLHAFRGARLRVLRHEVHVERWTSTTAELIRWYLDEFWSDLPPDPDRPEILVIVKLVCDPGLSDTTRKRAKRELRALCEPAGGGCRRNLLPDLEPVKVRDVEQWLKHHWPVGHDFLHRRLAEEVFTASDGRLLDSRSMEEVEDALRKLIERHPNRLPSRPPTPFDP